MNLKEYQSKVLKGQNLPADLKILLQMQDFRIESEEDVSDPLSEMGIYLLLPGDDPLPDDSHLSKKEKNTPFYKANYPAVMSVMKLITFAAQIIYDDGDEDPVGYWHGPENTPIEEAPIVKWSSDGFTVLPGKNLTEALLTTLDEEDDFPRIRKSLSEYGIRISARKISEIKTPKVKTHPNELHGILYSDNRTVSFQKDVLNGQTVPDDLRKLFRMQMLWPEEENSEIFDPLGAMNCRILMPGEKIGVMDKSYLSKADKKNADIMANVKAIDKVCSYITFAAYTDDSDLIGYWHGTENNSIEKAPIVMLDTEGQFSQLPGKNLTEALLSLQDMNNSEFKKYAKWFAEFHILITANSQRGMTQWPKSASSPQKIHQDLYEKYRRKK